MIPRNTTIPRRRRAASSAGRLLLAGGCVLALSAPADAQTLFNNTYTGTQLNALPNGASTPSGRTVTLTGTRLDFLATGGVQNDVLYRLPLVGAAAAGPLDFLRLTVTADMEMLTTDNDFAIVITDGTNIIGYQNGDPTNAGTSWHFSAADDGDSYSDADFTPIAITNADTFNLTINLSTGPNSSRVTTLQASETVTTNVSRPFDITQPLELLLVGDGAGEAYGVNSLSITLEKILPAEPVLRIDRDTGLVELRNESGAPLNLKGYTIASAQGALSGVNWLTIAQNYDSGNPGPNQVDPNDDWTRLSPTSSREELSEFEFGGDGATLAAGRVVNLGTGTWLQTNTEDVTLLYSAGGVVREGIVQFVGNGGEAFDFLDLNFDGEVDALDWAVFNSGQHANLSALSLAEAYRRGDLNGDKANNFADFRIFKDTFDALNGEGAFIAMLASVPEPGTFALLAVGAAMTLRRRPAAAR